MLANSLRLRGVKFAFLFGPPRFVKREEASQIHSAVCDSTRLDDFSFKYSTIEPNTRLESKGFSIVLERKEGRGALIAAIENNNINAPIRILLEYVWPQTQEHITDHFDTISTSVFNTLEGNWTKVLAEVRLRAQCSARSNNGLSYLKEKVLGLPQEYFSTFKDPLSFCSVKLEGDAIQPSPENQTEGAKRELLIEVLREDPKCIYLESVNQWPQIAPLPRNQASPIAIDSLRKIDDNPSVYIKEAFSFLNEQVSKLDEIDRR